MMTEQRFFHLALQHDLLDGSRLKQKLDAQLKLQTAASDAPVHKAARSAGKVRWAAVPAAAVLLILTLAIGTVVASRGLRANPDSDNSILFVGRNDAELGSTLEPSAAPQAETPVIVDQETKVLLLPEIDPEHLIDQMRINHKGLTAYEETDWAWLREAHANVTELSVKGDCLHWTVELRLQKGDRMENPFLQAVNVQRCEPHCLYTDANGNLGEDPRAKLVDLASPGEPTLAEENGEWIMRIPFVCILPRDEYRSDVLTAQCLMLLLDPQAMHGDEDYLMLTQVDEVTGERTPLVGSDELVPSSMIGTLELTFDFDSDSLPHMPGDGVLYTFEPTASPTPEESQSPEPTPTPEVLYTFVPTAYPDEIAYSPTPMPEVTEEPTAWPYPSDEDGFVPVATPLP